MKQEYIDSIRTFNRYYTKVLGVLNKHYLGSEFGVTEVRIIQDIYLHPHRSAKEIAVELDLDKGFLSRLLKQFEQKGYISKKGNEKDSRIGLINLTEKGNEVYHQLDNAASHSVEDMFAHLPEQQLQGIIQSMDTIYDVIRNGKQKSAISVENPSPVGQQREEDSDDTYTFRQAKNDDFSRVWEIVQQAVAQMTRENKQQWDDTYPRAEHIAMDIIKGYTYVLCNKKSIVACGAVVFDGEDSFKDIKGKWLSENPYVVLHRLAVASDMKCKGIATIFMQEVEKISKEKGVYSFKVDTNFDNFSMQKVLEKLGFTYCGEIFFQGGSRIAYEKLLR